MQYHGKLTVVEREGSEKEYLLARETITIGRAYDNDVILSDPKASRYHGELRRTNGRYEIVDLGSTNGTWMAGKRIQKYVLAGEATFRIGATELRFQPAEPDALPPSAKEEGGTIEITLAEVAAPRLIVHAAGATREVLVGTQPVNIGRDPENDVVIDDTKISRRHARVEREGDNYLVADLGSINGTWVQGERIQRRRLNNNDTIRIGSARIFFKAGLRAAFRPPKEEAQPARAAPPRFPKPKGPFRYPVVFIPGFMGSQLYHGDDKQWPNLAKFLGEGRTMMMPDQGLEVRGIVNEVVVVPHLIKLDAYGGFVDYLAENLGYRRGKNLLEFAYDFRADIRISAGALRDRIQEWQQDSENLPIIIVAHSMGGLVARYYIECLGGKEQVKRLITMGTPHYGTPKSFELTLSGESPLPGGLMRSKVRRVSLTYPSVYQVMPTYPVVHDERGHPIDMFQDDGWLPKRYRPLLHDGKAFREELGNQCAVPTMCIFGYGQKTLTKVAVRGRGRQRWSDEMHFEYQDDGDGTVPSRSALLEGAEMHPVCQAHGALYSDKDVKMRLRYELIERVES